MKHPVSPVFSTDLDALIHELCSPESTQKLLGQAGVWRGLESEILGLKGPVASEDLKKVLMGFGADGAEHPGGPWRPAQVPVGWRIELRTDYRHTTLWALGNEEVRNQLELNHQSAVNAVLDPFDAVMRRAAGYAPDSRVGMLIATFMQGANREQVPDLRTTVIIPNGHLRNDSSVMTFPQKEFLRTGAQLNRLYLCEFVPRVLQSFGSVGADPAHDVPKHIFSPPAQHPIISGTGTSNGTRSFFGEDLFTQWRREAQFQGFGQDRLASVLRAARHHRVEFGESNTPQQTMNLQRAAQKLWQLATGTRELGLSDRTKEQSPAL